MIMKTKHPLNDPKLAQAALHRVFAQTEIILSSIPSILIGVNQDGMVLHWNIRAEQTLGIPQHQVLGRPFAECGVHWDFDRIWEGINKCRLLNKPVRMESVSYRRQNGEEGFLGFSVIPLKQIASEAEIEFLLFGADITERKKIDQMKSDFVSTVSHELRTPLAVIKEGVLQVYEGMSGSINAGQKRLLAISLEGIERLGRIVDEILDLSKIEAGRLELRKRSVDLAKIARGVQTVFCRQAQEKNIQILIHMPAKVKVHADKDKVVQIFMNLISNALKFTEEGRIEIAAIQKAREVECSVSDTGIGIAECDLPKVFGKFQRFRTPSGDTVKGTGLGLAISKGYVEAHGGTMRVQSKQGAGTKFIFTFPSVKNG